MFECGSDNSASIYLESGKKSDSVGRSTSCPTFDVDSLVVVTNLNVVVIETFSGDRFTLFFNRFVGASESAPAHEPSLSPASEPSLRVAC